ncbi:hypothetical protein ACFQ9X_57180 [Catenulispora yoronensis]
MARDAVVTPWGETKTRDQCKFPWCKNPAEVGTSGGRPLGYCVLTKKNGSRAHTRGTAYTEQERLKAEAAGGAAVPAVAEADETRPYETAQLRGAVLLAAVRRPSRPGARPSRRW